MSKIVFIGGKAIGYGILSYLLETDEVVAIYTNPSDQHPTWFPSIKPLADKYNIPYYIRDVNDGIGFKHDYIICAYYDRIVKKEILNQPKIDAINIHMGLAEEYRGCYPTTFPIIDGKKWAGITIHRMTEGVDDGPIYWQLKVSVDPTDTGQTLYYKCTGAGIAAFIENWGMIKEGKILLRDQVTTKNTIYHKREDFPLLDLSNTPIEDMGKYIRALTFPPFPRPYIINNGKKIELCVT